VKKKSVIRADVHLDQKGVMVEAAEKSGPDGKGGKLDQWMITILMREGLKFLGFKSIADWKTRKEAQKERKKAGHK